MGTAGFGRKAGTWIGATAGLPYRSHPVLVGEREPGDDRRERDDANRRVLNCRPVAPRRQESLVAPATSV